MGESFQVVKVRDQSGVDLVHAASGGGPGILDRGEGCVVESAKIAGKAPANGEGRAG